MDVVVNPPKPGEESYDSWLAEKEAVLTSLAERAKLVADTFNGIEGFTCNTVQGAMYAFPQVCTTDSSTTQYCSRTRTVFFLFSGVTASHDLLLFLHFFFQ